MTRFALLLTGLLCVPAIEAVGQGSLEEAVEVARVAWLAHEADELVSRSDTVRLHLPGVAMSASVKPGQASRLINRYFEAADELTFDLREVRRMAADHAYAEIVRVFVIRGTSEERTETVFLGFRVLDGEWRLREVRITP